jgi:hypothetical protein
LFLVSCFLVSEVRAQNPVTITKASIALTGPNTIFVSGTTSESPVFLQLIHYNGEPPKYYPSPPRQVTPTNGTWSTSFKKNVGAWPDREYMITAMVDHNNSPFPASQFFQIVNGTITFPAVGGTGGGGNPPAGN